MRYASWLFVPTLSLFIVQMAPAPAIAQTDRATLTGVVTDPSQKVVARARIGIVAIETGIEHIGITSAAGVYTITSLPIGDCTAIVSAPGFEALKFERFALQVGQTRTLNATLAVRGVRTEVTVVEAAPDQLCCGWDF